jgi:23S rRNA (pseudouridine1915-N3)-methyltransferase
MRIHIGAIGKLKKGAEKALSEEYFDRLKKTGPGVGISGLDVKEYPESQAATPSLRKADEAARLLAGCPQGAVIIVLDEHGKDNDSKTFSSLIEKLKDNGTRHLAIFIGGPDGHDATILTKATHKFAFGSMTWPHRLVRIMLAEQLYRSVTIMLNHPYHRE